MVPLVEGWLGVMDTAMGPLYPFWIGPYILHICFIDNYLIHHYDPFTKVRVSIFTYEFKIMLNVTQHNFYLAVRLYVQNHAHDCV